MVNLMVARRPFHSFAISLAMSTNLRGETQRTDLGTRRLDRAVGHANVNIDDLGGIKLGRHDDSGEGKNLEGGSMTASGPVDGHRDGW